MRLYIDDAACIGCGVCAGICADSFEMLDDQRHARVMQDPPDRDHVGCVQTAVGDCPTHAIHFG
uniref:4Fe-4S ferredoxin-type domain-containing protein n=1 Tax=termite gut metagenome TaxID=433724 RepID=S0DEW2_9ZZZZ